MHAPGIGKHLRRIGQQTRGAHRTLLAHRYGRFVRGAQLLRLPGLILATRGAEARTLPHPQGQTDVWARP